MQYDGFDPSTRRFMKTVVAGGVVLAAGCTTLGGESAPEEGFEYRAAASPVRPDAGGKLEVVEFFWYGCPHCNAFEAPLGSWLARLPADVAFRKVHVGLSPRWVPHQQLFYALEQLGRTDATTARVFHAIHVDKASLDERDAMADFVAKQGVERRAFVEAFDSPQVAERMKRADTLAAAFGVQGVPNLGVHGKWLTSPGMAGSYADALRVVDFLLAKERSPAPR
jgi:thiol:disulfide interchange protein DsbA